jgi:hypothetical protein
MYTTYNCPHCMRPVHDPCGGIVINCGSKGTIGQPCDDSKDSRESAAKKSCIWDGKETSHGGIHCHNGHAYKCQDGEWLKDTSSNDECNSPQPSPVG